MVMNQRVSESAKEDEMDLLELEFVFYNTHLQIIGNAYVRVRDGGVDLPVIPWGAVQMQLVLHGVLMGRPVKLYSAMVGVRDGRVAAEWIRFGNGFKSDSRIETKEG